MEKTLVTFFDLLKKICVDISFLYKNFFHWNISKILILIASFLVGALLSLPFFLLMGILALIDPIDWPSIFASDINIYMNIAQYLTIHPFYLLAEFVLFIIGITFLFLGMSYQIILESNLYLHYFKKEKLPFKNNYYFDASKVSTYFGILGWIMIYLLLPIIVLIISFLVLFLIYKFLFVPEMILSAGVFIALVICFIWFLYLSYRLSFSYLVFLDRDNTTEKQKPKSYVKKSLSLTSGKVFFKFLPIVIIFTILLAPMNIIGASIENNINDIRNYFGYKSGQIQMVDDSDRFEYEYLQSLFVEDTDEELIGNLQFLYTQQVIFTVLAFLFIGGLFTMIMTSFYKRALILQWGKVKDDSKKEKQKKEESEKKEKKKSADKEQKKKIKK